MESAISGSIEGIRDVWKRYLFLVGLEDENRALKRKIDNLTAELINYREVYLEGLRLKDHLALRESSDVPMITARVIGRENTSVFKSVLINKGSVDGIRAGLPVISPEGVVGRTVEASWNVSRVLLITDFNSNVDVLIQGSRSQGILQGGGATGCILKYVDRSEELKIGDAVLTSGHPMSACRPLSICLFLAVAPLRGPGAGARRHAAEAGARFRRRGHASGLGRASGRRSHRSRGARRRHRCGRRQGGQVQARLMPGLVEGHSHIMLHAYNDGLKKKQWILRGRFQEGPAE